jgi:pantoate--beta-alanine ligase
MQIIKTIKECNTWRDQAHGSIGIVPTMGALHRGHLSLVTRSLKMCDVTVVTLFLNPAQFGEDEDLDQYPKTLETDLKLLEGLNVDLVFTPDTKTMYKKDHSFYMDENLLSKYQEGISRPDFFKGVCTIVAKIFNIFNPSHAFFGEKDAQQLHIIKKMIADMNYAITLVPCPTIRDERGLALSSRNQYLGPAEQKQAALIYRSLMRVKDALDGGQKNAAVLKEVFKNSLIGASGFRIDYISIASSQTLEEVQIVDRDILVSTAVFFGNIRLIDNFSYAG